MELNQLHTFVTVAQEQHLTRAAERLHTSQPAVSAKLKALEESLGITLFDRTPKGMKLTASGEALLVQAQVILDAAKLLSSQAKNMQGQVMGQLSVGVNSDLPFLRLPEILADTAEVYPNLQLSLVNGMSPDIVLDIRKGKLDTGFMFGPVFSADLHVLQIAEIEMAIVAPVSWADKVVKKPLADLAVLPWVYTTNRCPYYHLTEALFNDLDVQPIKTVFVDTEAAIRDLVKSGSGISVLRVDDAERAEVEGWGIRWQGRVPSIALNVAMQARRVQEPLMSAWLKELSKFWSFSELDVEVQKVS